MHTPVLPKETIESLAVKPGGTYIDATVGEGGHLKQLSEAAGEVLAIDWDADQISKLKISIKKATNIKFSVGNYADMKQIARKNKISQVDGILLDLGLSMEQIKNSGKGFSFKNGLELLDMRLNNTIEETASDLINKSSKDELYEIFAGYSEELNSQSIASSIYRARLRKKIHTVSDLVNAINTGVTPGRHTIMTNVYARIFQALRIAVNNEFENIKKALSEASSLLKKGGRLVIITFHSLEDRTVKSTTQKDKSLKELKKISGRRYGSHGFERSALLRVFIKI